MRTSAAHLTGLFACGASPHLTYFKSNLGKKRLERTASNRLLAPAHKSNLPENPKRLLQVAAFRRESHKINMKPKSLTRQRKEEGSDGSTSNNNMLVADIARVVEEAERENQLHRDLSDLFLGCCSSLDQVVQDDDDFDIDRELEELEKEIALAKQIKPKVSACNKKILTTASTSSSSMYTSSPKPEEREIYNKESDDSSSAANRASPSNSLHSSSWTEELIDSNVDFLIGSCSSRQVDVSTTFEI